MWPYPGFFHLAVFNSPFSIIVFLDCVIIRESLSWHLETAHPTFSVLWLQFQHLNREILAWPLEHSLVHIN